MVNSEEFYADMIAFADEAKAVLVESKIPYTDDIHDALYDYYEKGMSGCEAGEKMLENLKK